MREGGIVLVKHILTIAGSDSTGGGGFEADLRTFQEYELFGYSAVTCIVTIQHEKEVDIYPIPTEVLDKQLQTLLDSSVNLPYIKVGMLGSLENVTWFSQFIQEHPNKQFIIDPVFSFKETGSYLKGQTDIVSFYQQEILPHTFLTTPNLLEASLLADMPPVTSESEMKEAAEKIWQLGVQHVVIKGGTRMTGEEAVDLYYDGQSFQFFRLPKLTTNRINGAGCTFASAIAARLAQEATPVVAIKDAKEFVHQSIQGGQPFYQAIGNVWQGANRS